MATPPLDPSFIVKTRIVRAFVDGDKGEFIGWYLQKEAPQILQAMKGESLDDVKGFLASDMILKELIGQEGVEEFLEQVLAFVNDEQPGASVAQ